MEYSPETMRARFAELAANRADILEVSAPLRTQRDQLVRQNLDAIASLDDQIASAEETLFKVDQELALISRALGGKTGV